MKQAETRAGKVEITGRLQLEYLLRELLADGIVTAEQCAALRARAPLRGDDDRHPLVRIADQGWISADTERYPLTLEQLTRWLAGHTHLPYVRIDPLKIDVEAVTRVASQAYTTRFQILPIKVDDNTVTIATCEPFVREWEGELAHVLKRKVRRVLANPRDIARYVTEFYGVSRSISGATASTAGPLSEVGNFEQLTQLGKVGEPDANDRHIVHLVDWLLQYAFDQRASDIHVEPRRERGNIRFRIDGLLHLIHELPAPVLAAITSRIKSLGRMDVADRRRPQDGRIKSKTPAGREVEMRLSTMPTAFGEKLVIRIFDPSMLTRSFAELGFEARDIEIWERLTGHPHGVILVTGPTGSGKTTTLYSALKRVARPERNLCTIEDPIEMVEPAFNQMQVQPQIDLDFASGVRTLLRQDPDIIMIGEIRDRATADVAVQAALTGHLVFSTLHTNDAPSAVTRLMELGVQPYLISATLLGVMAQRLVRVLCPHCKQPTAIDETAWHALTAPRRIKVPPHAFRPVGCDECRHTGYLGRAGLYEIMAMTPELSVLLKDGLDTALLRASALRGGMWQLRDSGAHKIAKGLTTLEEVFGVIPPRE